MFRKSLFILFLLALALTFSQASLAAPDEEPIFSDDFESGNLLAWSSKKTDKGDLAVTWPAALEGAKGMRVRIDDTNRIYVTDDTPDREVSYTAKFLFDPNAIYKHYDDDANTIFLAEDMNPGITPVLRVIFYMNAEAIKPEGRQYSLTTFARNDDQTWSKARWRIINNQPHEIKIEWHASEADGMNNGQLMFFIDSVLQESLTGIDNDTLQIDRVRLGAMGAIKDTTSGTYFIDAFESFRGTSTGLLNP